MVTRLTTRGVSLKVLKISTAEAVNAIREATGQTVAAILYALNIGVVFTVGNDSYVL